MSRLIAILRFVLMVVCLCELCFAEVKLEYDRFEDRTTVSINLNIREDSRKFSVLNLNSSAIFPGRKAEKLVEDHYVLFTRHDTEWRADIETRLTLLVDGERLHFKGTRGDTSYRVFFQFTLAQLQKISKAELVEGRANEMEFVLTAQHKRELSEYLVRISPK